MEFITSLASSKGCLQDVSWHQARVGLACVLFPYICLVYYIECYVISPAFLEFGSGIHTTLCIIATYALANVLFNAYSTMFCNPSVASLMLVQQANTDWSYCLKCESVRPPRAHHCRRCDICIIRFDHHCTFLGTLFNLAVAYPDFGKKVIFFHYIFFCSPMHRTCEPTILCPSSHLRRILLQSRHVVQPPLRCSKYLQ